MPAPPCTQVVSVPLPHSRHALDRRSWLELILTVFVQDLCVVIHRLLAQGPEDLGEATPQICNVGFRKLMLIVVQVGSLASFSTIRLERPPKTSWLVLVWQESWVARTYCQQFYDLAG